MKTIFLRDQCMVELHNTLIQESRNNTVWCRVGYFKQFPFLIKEAASYTLQEMVLKHDFKKNHARYLKDFLLKISKNGRIYLDMHPNNIMFNEKTNNFVLVDSKPPKGKTSFKKAYKANIEELKNYITTDMSLKSLFLFFKSQFLDKYIYKYKNNKNRLVMKKLLKDLDNILRKLK